MLISLFRRHKELFATTRERRNDHARKGQIMLEFTFSMIICLIMIFGVIMIFRWVGYDFAWRRVDHDLTLMNSVVEDYSVYYCCEWEQVCSGTSCNTVCSLWCVDPEGPIEQLDPYFHRPAKMNAAWGL